jgi:hypothetical protein
VRNRQKRRKAAEELGQLDSAEAAALEAQIGVAPRELPPHLRAYALQVTGQHVCNLLLLMQHVSMYANGGSRDMKSSHWLVDSAAPFVWCSDAMPPLSRAPACCRASRRLGMWSTS